MNLLFVNPSLRPEAPHRYLPVGLGYIVTSVDEAAFDFKILDVDIDRLSDQEVESHFIRNNYDVVAVGSIVTHYKWIKWLIGVIKKHQPYTKVIVGNSVGGSIPELLFAHTKVDVVVVGEGDVTIVEVLKALNEGRDLGEALVPEVSIAHNNGPYPNTIKGIGIEGIIFRDPNGHIINTGRRKAKRIIDDFPYPDWGLFDVEHYIEDAKSTAHDTPSFPKSEAVVFPINTARGCVFKCTFCHYVFWNDPYRHRSPKSILGEMRHNIEKYGANYFNFWDELSFHKLRPAEKFVDSLIDADLGIYFTAAIRTDLFGRSEVPYDDRWRIAQKFKKAGAVSLGYSLESGNDEILEAMNKRVKAGYFGEQVEILRRAGIMSNTSLVFGYPQETAKTIAETMQMCLKMKVYPSPGFLIPLPATGMWDKALKNGHIIDPDKYLTEMTERQDLVINMTSMSDYDLQKEVTDWLARLSDTFQLGLSGGALIRTETYDKQTKNQEKEVMFHRDTTETLNYAAKTGSV